MYGASPTTISQWARKYAKGGLAALENAPRGRGEPSGAHRDPASLVVEALADYFHTHPGRRERLDRLSARIGPKS